MSTTRCSTTTGSRRDLASHVEHTFGKAGNERFWVLYEEQRIKHGYVDVLGALERFRLEHIDNPSALRLANWLLDYPFIERLYPDVFALVRHVRQWGLPVILTDGDGVFQPHKLVRAGLWDAFDGHVLGYVHKEQELDAIQRAYPARHYVMVDDKLTVLNAVKNALGDAGDHRVSPPRPLRARSENFSRARSRRTSRSTASPTLWSMISRRLRRHCRESNASATRSGAKPMDR